MEHAQLLTQMLGGEWKSHPLHSNYYFSREGHAARASVRRGTVSVAMLKGCECGAGYRAISYPIGNGRYGRLYIHRAVCELFNGAAPDGMPVVRHLDCNMNNNRASNLAWGTAQDNAEDANRNGKTAYGERNGMAKLTTKDVATMRQLRIDNKTTFKQLAAQFGVTTMTAHRAITGVNWK